MCVPAESIHLNRAAGGAQSDAGPVSRFLPIKRFPFGIDEPQDEITAVHFVQLVTVAAAGDGLTDCRVIIWRVLAAMRMIAPGALLGELLGVVPRAR